MDVGQEILQIRFRCGRCDPGDLYRHLEERGEVRSEHQLRGDFYLADCQTKID